MNSTETTQATAVALPMTMAPEPRADGFVHRRHIALLEEDRALRSVLTRALLRVGCVVQFKHSREAVLCALRDGRLDGAVVAAECDSALLASLDEANHQQVPIILLGDTTVSPREMELYSNLHFVQKPFDMRVLYERLRLPHRANPSSD